MQISIKRQFKSPDDSFNRDEIAIAVARTQPHPHLHSHNVGYSLGKNAKEKPDTFFHFEVSF